jgi:pimeloyl-ACP methyl ester carboxylesterase
VRGRRLEYVDIPARRGDRPPLVLLHEGLGCVGMWRDFPLLLARATGCRTVVYSRLGHGCSDPLDAPRQHYYLHDEALVYLAGVREALDLAEPVLVGHSDGASIALMHAGACGPSVAGVVAMAPHEFVEEITLEGIRAAVEGWEASGLRQRLERLHRDPAGVFRAWHETWLDPAFRGWNIELYLPGIRCPILAIQGYDDEYATMAQLDAIAAGAAAPPRVEQLRLADCGHAPHRDAPEEVLSAIASFVDSL